jgi:hypothetical protein
MSIAGGDSMFRLIAVGVALVLSVSGMAKADDLTRAMDAAHAQGSSVSIITPVFSQLVMLSFPKGFKPAAFEKTQGNFYIQESVLDGETVEAWSQLITLTGFKGLAADPGMTPQLLVARIAGSFKSACPDTFALQGLGPVKIGAYDGFAALAGCGSVRGANHSETAYILGVKGTVDFYTVQWAERTPASATSAVLDVEKWSTRFKQLTPIKLCARVPGEPKPYPSCVNQK